MQEVDPTKGLERESAARVHGSHAALVARVAASSSFLKSNRLRELLLFLCERALSDPNGTIREADVGAGVFGRQPGYDTAQDPLVRVQVSQLRKKLQQYFLDEGRDEPVTIEIPKGAYTPVFCVRPVEPVTEPPPAPAPTPAPAPLSRAAWLRKNRMTLALALLAVAIMVTTGFLLFRPRPPLRPIADSGPAVDRLWTQMFDGSRPVCIVLSDASLVQFESMLKYQLTLDDYRNKYFGALADERVTVPVEKNKALATVSNPFTYIADSQLAAAFSLLNASHRIPTDIVSARDFGVSYLYSHDVILLGSRRANPWMEFFENQLNFRSGFDETGPRSYFQNHAPQPGELATYPVTWGSLGYCRVVHLPDPTRNGTVLLISGTAMVDTEAGGAFVSSNAWIRTLRSTLQMAPQDRFPYFEVLLKVEYMAHNAAPRFSIAAHRIIKR
jgi:hypothetical protein